MGIEIFLALAAIAASLIQTTVSMSASSAAEGLATEQGKQADAFQRKQIREAERARRKGALQRALRIPGKVETKILMPPKTLTDPSIARKQRLANIFGGIGGAIGAASQTDFGGLTSSRGVTPGINAVYDPSSVNPYA